MQPAPDKSGDLGIYRLYGPAQLRRVCRFDAHIPIAHPSDSGAGSTGIKAFERAAGPLLPTGRLCPAVSDTARTLADHAAWRPWVLDRRPGTGRSERRANCPLHAQSRADRSGKGAATPCLHPAGARRTMSRTAGARPPRLTEIAEMLR